MSLPKWNFKYYYKEDRNKLFEGHVFAPTQARACLNFQAGFPNAFMKDYPTVDPSMPLTGGGSQEDIAMDSLNNLGSSTTGKPNF